MTTINNFLHANFLEMPQENALPVWTISFPKNTHYKDLRNYFIQNSIKNNKYLFHIDLGISEMRIVNSQLYKKKILNNGMNIYVNISNQSHYLLYNSIQEKSQNKYYQELILKIKEFPFLEDIQKQVKNKKITLFIEGIQTIYSLNKHSKELESFVSQINNFSYSYGQVTIFILENEFLPKEIMFSLERVSTCTTKINKLPEIGVWLCSSTVRRHTGFSNSQEYAISLKQGKAKIQKKLKQACQKQTEAQKQMINSLGFIVKKGNQLNEQQKDIKKMIYPHLHIQDCKNCNCLQKSCRTCNPQNDEGLIILDDEQQDDDDIDV